MLQGTAVLDVARQMAADANYCLATGLHATSSDEDKPLTSPAGYLAEHVICYTILDVLILQCFDTVICGHVTVSGQNCFQDFFTCCKIITSAAA